MNKYFLLLLLGILWACDEHHSENQSNDEDSSNPESQSETKKEKLVSLYKDSVIPLFKDIPDVNPPQEIHINAEDVNIDAGAASDYLEVSQGLIDLENEAIQLIWQRYLRRRYLILQRLFQREIAPMTIKKPSIWQI